MIDTAEHDFAFDLASYSRMCGEEVQQIILCRGPRRPCFSSSISSPFFAAKKQGEVCNRHGAHRF